MSATPAGGFSDAALESHAWRDVLAPHMRAHHGRATLGLLTSVGAYFAIAALMCLTVRFSYTLTVALSIPAAVCLVRTFIVFHDCAHGSFLGSKRANVVLGTALGVLLCSPYARWKHDHAIHHATSGDLERRGTGDLHTLTVREYHELTPRAQLSYRLMRNPVVMFGLGPLLALIIGQRFVPSGARPRLKRSVIQTNIGIAVSAGLACWLIGWSDVLLVYLLPALVAGSAGIWLFYVQHQFEDAYWTREQEWSFSDAALKGSSFLDLHPFLHFCTGNIGYHHVHHLSARIPHYNLPAAHEQSAEIFGDAPRLSLLDGMRAVRLKLWDEDSGRLVTFAQAAAPRAVAAQP